jgi:uncharacterized protein
LLAAGVVSAQTAGVAVRDLEIDLGEGFITKAQLTYPAEGTAPFPTVILLHGSGPYDMDATYSAMPGEEPLSANFRLLAERLPEAGIAVLRFNKRGVLGNNEYDTAQIQSADADRLTEDAAAVVQAALEQPEVDADRLYLYGWSEGAVVAANYAAQQPDAVAGLILQGAPNGDLAHVLAYQELDVALPYLIETADSDTDGALSLAEVQALPAGPVSYMAAFFLYDRASTPEKPLLNTFVDSSGNGTIEIEAELRPVVEQYIENYPAFAPKVSASFDLADLIPGMDMPVLLLHGENDGWVSLADAQTIAEAAPEQVTFNAYPGLGHALSETTLPAEDDFGVMSDEPVADMIRWILEG